MPTMHFSFTMPIADIPGVRRARKPVRGRNAKMDTFLRQVNGSARYAASAIEAQVAFRRDDEKKK